MKLICFARGAQVSILIGICAFPVAGRPQRKQPAAPEAVNQIRGVLDRQVECWNRGDLEGFMRGYWRSPELTFYTAGTALSGWDATLQRYRQRYQSEGREMGKLDFTDLKIELLGQSAAFARGRWHLKMSTGDVGGLFTLTFRKLADGWKIVHDHTSSS